MDVLFIIISSYTLIIKQNTMIILLLLAKAEFLPELRILYDYKIAEREEHICFMANVWKK